MMIGSQEIEQLARKIAGPTADQITLSFARAAAEAEFDLARIRQAKVALMKHPVDFGLTEKVSSAKTLKPFPERPDATISSQDPGIVDAVRHSLPELLKLARYERASALRRDRALQQVILRSSR